MAWLIEGLSHDPLYSPVVGWRDMPSGFSVNKYNKRCAPVNLGEVPATAVVVSRHKRLPDFFAVMALWAVSEQFRDIVETLEPGIHQFLPMKISRKSGAPIDRNCYLLNVCQRIDDAIIVEKSEIKWNETVGKAPDGSETQLRYATLLPPPRLVLRRDLIAGRHMWRSYGLISTGLLFFSDELIRRIELAALKKLRTIQCREYQVHAMN